MKKTGENKSGLAGRLKSNLRQRRRGSTKVNLKKVPEKYRPLVRKIVTFYRRRTMDFYINQSVRFPDGFELKTGDPRHSLVGGRDKSRVELMHLPADLSGRSVLDIGCNIGAFAIECKKRKARRVVGVDHHPDIIECARDVAGLLGLAIEYEQLDLTENDIEEEFDYVFFLNVFQHLDQHRAVHVLRMLDRITRKALFFEAPIAGDEIIREERCYSESDYHCYLKGFTTFPEIETLGMTERNRPLIRCRR